MALEGRSAGGTGRPESGKREGLRAGQAESKNRKPESRARKQRAAKGKQRTAWFPSKSIGRPFALSGLFECVLVAHSARRKYGYIFA